MPDNYFSRLDLDKTKLASLLDTINDIDTVVDSRQDVIGRVYEYFLGKFALKESSGKGLVIASPKKGIITIKPNELSSYFEDGIDIILLEKKNTTPEQNFGISWFIPALKKHRRVLIQVLFASFVVQLFTLANPLLIQVIIDKVINQRSLATLEILGVAIG